MPLLSEDLNMIEIRDSVIGSGRGDDKILGNRKVIYNEMESFRKI